MEEIGRGFDQNSVDCIENDDGTIRDNISLWMRQNRGE